MGGEINLMTRFLITIIPILLTPIMGTHAHGFDATLAWDPNLEPNIVGYYLYTGENGSGSYYQVDYYSLDELDPQNPQCSVTDMEGGITYHFVVTAVNNAGLESRYSNNVSILNGRTIVTVSSGGGGGGGCFMSTAINPHSNR